MLRRLRHRSTVPEEALFVRLWWTGRAVEEQLAELTRLVLRLPEVDALLQRAGLQPPAGRLEPSPALELFIKVAALCMKPPLRTATLYGHGFM